MALHNPQGERADSYKKTRLSEWVTVCGGGLAEYKTAYQEKACSEENDKSSGKKWRKTKHSLK